MNNNMKTNWTRGKEVRGNIVIFSKCERFSIHKFESFMFPSQAVWELRDDYREVESFERLSDAKAYANQIIADEETD